MRALWAGLFIAAVLAVGCDSDEGEAGPRRSPGFVEKRVVREWITALNGGDVNKAARYFAKGAIVDQGRPIRLPTAAAARFFNASLPCRADLVEVKDEPGPKALASFRLRAGPGGPCEGTAQVRVTVEHGRFTVWRQLPETLDEPSGPVV
jgi:hypothetical protein